MRWVVLASVLGVCFHGPICSAQSPQQRPPNVLFIAVDDMNDWVSPLGGHPQAQTPHLDEFVRRGSVVFQNARCAGPVCGPSRSALLSGFMPHRTGIYGNANNMRASDLVQANATLPEYFAQHGYRTISRGKIFHSHNAFGDRDRGQWAFQDWSDADRGIGVDPDRVTSRNKNLVDGKRGKPLANASNGGSEFAWGPTRGPMEETSDYKVARWAAEQLQAEQDQPFFLAVGLFRPHLPFYAPQEFFDLYDRDSVEVPPINESDLDDILTPSGRPKFAPNADYRWLKQNNLLPDVVRAYLAMISYADANLGEIFESLKTSPYADNTIVVLWGDHGWHLGEKLRYRKATGWTESTRVPLIVRTPTMSQRQDSAALVNLIDLYPTLADYCGLPAKTNLDGRSFTPLLSSPNQPWNQTTRTMFGHGNVAIFDGRWHFIAHKDGTRELYDHQNDPQEWTNLATSDSPDAVAARTRLAKQIPTSFAPPVGKPPKYAPNEQRDLAALK